MNLYQISQDYRVALNDALMEDEISIDMVDVLSKLEGAIDDKAIAIAAYIKNIETEAESVRNAIKEMKLRAERLDNKSEFLSNYLKHNLESCGIKEVRKSPHFIIKIKQNPASVMIENEDLIPDEYIKIKQVISIDKAAIKKDIEQGVIVEGASLQKNTRLEIK